MIRSSRTLWIAAVVLGLGIGTWGVTRYAPPVGIGVGDRLTDVRVQHLGTGDSVWLRKDYSGHVTLINLWATYCVPCRKEMPSIEALYQRHKDRGFRVAAVSLDDAPTELVEEFAKDLRVSFEILQDRSNITLQTFQGMGLPYSILLDRHGKVVYLALGAEDWNSEEHRARVEALLR